MYQLESSFHQLLAIHLMRVLAHKIIPSDHSTLMLLLSMTDFATRRHAALFNDISLTFRLWDVNYRVGHRIP